MNAANLAASLARRQPLATGPADVAEAQWAPLYRIAGVAALAQVALIAIQIPLFILRPPPDTIGEWFALYERNPLLGFLNLDGLMLVNCALMFPILLALYAALRRIGAAPMALALTLGVVGNALGFAWNASISMLALSDGYAAATTAADRATFLAAGQTLLTNHLSGTAFVAYYLLGSATVLIIGATMLRGSTFGKWTAYAALAMGALTLVPPTESLGTFGVIVSVLALLPTALWFVLTARDLFRLYGDASPARRA